MHARFGVSLTVVLALSSAGSALGQTYEGARLLGLAETQRALTTGNDSIYLNPAGIAQGRLYSIELGYLDDARGSDRRFNASVVDSQAGPVSGGLAYTYTRRRPDDMAGGDQRLIGHRAEAALATRLSASSAVGVTLRYLSFNRVDGDDNDVEGGRFSLFTADVGLQWRLLEQLSLGLVGYNLTNSDRPEAPIGWGAGLGYQLGALTAEGDVRYNAKIGKARYSGALGFVLSEVVPIRAGLSYDLANEKFALSLGTGFVAGRLSLDVGYRQLLNADGDTDDADERILGVAVRTVVF